MEVNELKPVIECLLLVSDVPLTLGRMKEVIDGRMPVEKLRQAIDELKEEYTQNGRAFTVSEVAEGFLLSSLPEYGDWIRRLYKGKLTTKLSKPALETLAIIAFKQPITRSDIEALRGVDAGGVLSNLLERKLIAISGRDPGPGKPLIYVTTKEFLRYFGLNKLSELPRPRELEELLKEREQEQMEMFGDLPPEEAAALQERLDAVPPAPEQSGEESGDDAAPAPEQSGEDAQDAEAEPAADEAADPSEEPDPSGQPAADDPDESEAPRDDSS